MILRQTERFLKAYASLTADEQRQVDTRLRLLAEDPRHPSLRAQKWAEDIWYARASRDIRLFYEVHEDHYLLVDMGHHDIERSK